MRKASLLLALLFAASVPTLAIAQEYEHAAAKEEGGKIPITTASDEALQLFIEGRDLAEKLRAQDARPILRQAIEKDPNFAMAYLALANAAGSNEEFFTSLEKAVELSGNATEAEKMAIKGLDAGVRGNPDKQLKLYKKLVEMYPNDERAHNLLANNYFGRQNYDKAIAHYEKAIAINADYSPPYNSLGYASRAAGDFDKSEKAFQSYIGVLPGEPNPHDSYAELLMKLGRYDESIEQYRKALEADPSFNFSYVGIANNQMLKGQTEEARATLAEMFETAETYNIRRNALLWTAASYLHEGDLEEAMEEMGERYEIAEENNDYLAMSNDHNQIGMAYLWSGDAASAAKHFDKAVEVVEMAAVPDEVKEGTKRNHLYNLTMAALKVDDIATAKEKAAAYHEVVAEHNVPFEVRQDHELMGRIALAEGNYDGALTHLASANHQDPRVLYAMADAYHGKGDHAKSKKLAQQCADFNQLSFPLSYVRAEAQTMLAQAGE